MNRRSAIRAASGGIIAAVVPWKRAESILLRASARDITYIGNYRDATNALGLVGTQNANGDRLVDVAAQEDIRTDGSRYWTIRETWEVTCR